ncbi:MAG: A/G-specific adenine glycosylase, partial [Acidimicrobiales bacterium]
AYERDVAVVDANCARVLARLAGRPLHLGEAQARADALVPAGSGWAWNQAMIELGAVVCRRTPACGRCPAVEGCAWARAGWPPPDPARKSAAATRPQSRFSGSDRQGRGRLVAALRAGPVPVDDIEGVTGWAGDPVRARRVAAGLVADGLAVVEAERLRLP